MYFNPGCILRANIKVFFKALFIRVLHSCFHVLFTLPGMTLCTSILLNRIIEIPETQMWAPVQWFGTNICAASVLRVTPSSQSGTRLCFALLVSSFLYRARLSQAYRQLSFWYHFGLFSLCKYLRCSTELHEPSVNKTSVMFTGA